MRNARDDIEIEEGQREEDRDCLSQVCIYGELRRHRE